MEKEFDSLVEFYYEKLLKSLNPSVKNLKKKQLLGQERKQVFLILTNKVLGGSVSAYKELKEKGFFSFLGGNGGINDDYKFVVWYKNLLNKINQSVAANEEPSVELKAVFREATNDFYLNWQKVVATSGYYHSFGYNKVLLQELVHEQRSAFIEFVIENKGGKEFLAKALDFIDLKEFEQKSAKEFAYLMKKACFYEIDESGNVLGQLFVNLSDLVIENQKKLKLLKNQKEKIDWSDTFLKKINNFSKKYKNLPVEVKSKLVSVDGRYIVSNADPIVFESAEYSALESVNGSFIENGAALKEYLRQLISAPVVLFKDFFPEILKKMDEDNMQLGYQLGEFLYFLKDNVDLFKLLLIGAQKEIKELFNHKNVHKVSSPGQGTDLYKYFKKEKAQLNFSNFEVFLIKCLDCQSFCNKVERDDYFVNIYRDIFEKLNNASSNKFFHWCVLKGVPQKLIKDTVGLFDKDGVPYVYYQILPAFDWRTCPPLKRNVSARDISRNIKYLEMPLSADFWNCSAFIECSECPIPILKSGATMKDFFSVYEKSFEQVVSQKTFSSFNKDLFNEVKCAIEVAQLNAQTKRGKKVKNTIRL